MLKDFSFYSQMCVNSYKGKYGKELWIDISDYKWMKKKHTEWFYAIKGDELIIVFQGSQGLKDWKDNFNFFLRSWKLNRKEDKSILSYNRLNEKGVAVHKGFYKQYNTIKHDIHSIIEKYNKPKITICGHSLGGAIAHLCYYNIARKFEDKEISCFTEGAPRFFNKKGLEIYSYRCPYSYVFVNGVDIVSAVPFWLDQADYRYQLNRKHTKWYMFPLRIINRWRNHYPNLYLKAIKKEYKIT